MARYFLPSVDEWYKAAYYDPASVIYYDYPTGSNLVPTAVASGTAAGTAVYNQPIDDTAPADITLAGGLSPYGTMGQGGNAFEWEETDWNLMNDLTSSFRGVRGGVWVNPSEDLAASYRTLGRPSSEFGISGFRVASIPEPSTLLLGTMATVGLLVRRRSLR